MDKTFAEYRATTLIAQNIAQGGSMLNDTISVIKARISTRP